MNIKQDTICAIATAPGGAIGIIRTSGPEAIIATERLFTPHTHRNIPLSKRKSYTLNFGQILNEDGKVLDEVLVSLFRAPHSYTGEDATEISCHASPFILRQVMKLLINNGCRVAAPGEFTQRAFLNGKLDLSQAEAVADVIAADSAAAHRLAMNQMRGGFSRELAHLRDKLLQLTSLMELELDFSDHEDLEFADRSELQAVAAQIEAAISHLVQSFSVGNVLKNGIPVAIIGETNAGKSTLLNTLLHEEKAIVSDIHGTTRDVIEDTININGTLFRFIDTAGIRETQDTVESMGIERSFQKLDQARIVLWVIDSVHASEEIAHLAPLLLPHCEGKELLLVYNKADVTTHAVTPPSLSMPYRAVSVSAKVGIGIDRLEGLLIDMAALPSLAVDDVVVTNMRHYEALTRALDSIHRVQSGLQTHLSGDFIAQDLRECLFHLGDIIGEVTTDEVLGNVFRHFCIGK